MTLKCPNCDCRLTVDQLLRMLRPNGYVQRFHVRLPDGRIVLLAEPDINPQEVVIIEPTEGAA